MRFPQTIRLDGTDERVFERAAAPGEWAVTGGFAFATVDPGSLRGKARQAFANGFLGTTSFGWSTFAIVKEIDADAFEMVVRRLAAHFVAAYGAPDLTAALPTARTEADFAASLCEHRVNTLLAVERAMGEDGLIERFRTVEPPRQPVHARIWEIVEES